MEKYYGGDTKDVYKIVTSEELWICVYEPETKQQSIVWALEPEPNPTKVVCEKITSKQTVSFSSAKLFMWRQFHLSIIEPSILDGTPQFALDKFEKLTREDESLFTMAMRALTHHLKSAAYWQARTLNLWFIRLHP